MHTLKSKQDTLHLTPRVHPAVDQFVENKDVLFELIDGLGSPLNLLFPEIVGHNVRTFNSIFDKHGIIGRIFFAHKCNQSDSLVRQLSFENCSIDVSSVKELQHALGAGFRPERIEVTGPKNQQLLALSVQQGAWINIDSIPELHQLIELAAKINPAQKPRVLLRLSGFRSEHSRFLNKGSRFGIGLNEIEFALDELQSANHIELTGFSFHLDTVSVLERVVAIENCIDVIELAFSKGFTPSILDIGGGYKVNYLAEDGEWNAYTSALKESVLGTGPSMTWQGNSFGLHPEKGVLKGNFNSYSYYDDHTGPLFLDEMLSQKLLAFGGISVASFLRDNMIQLWIEPGRALVDQCGVTVASVLNVRPASNGEVLVALSMKRQDICFLDQEIFVDPIVVYRGESREQADCGVYFAGNLCLESDLIYRHKTFLSALPSPGDLVLFVNTAGYFMDFSASNSIMQPIARKVAITQAQGRPEWCLDDCYFPFNLR